MKNEKNSTCAIDNEHETDEITRNRRKKTPKECKETINEHALGFAAWLVQEITRNRRIRLVV